MDVVASAQKMARSSEDSRDIGHCDACCERGDLEIAGVVVITTIKLRLHSSIRADERGEYSSGPRRFVRHGMP